MSMTLIFKPAELARLIDALDRRFSIVRTRNEDIPVLLRYITVEDLSKLDRAEAEFILKCWKRIDESRVRVDGDSPGDYTVVDTGG